MSNDNTKPCGYHDEYVDDCDYCNGAADRTTPMGYSAWLSHGERYGYYKFAAEQAQIDRLTALVDKPGATHDDVYYEAVKMLGQLKSETLVNIENVLDSQIAGLQPPQSGEGATARVTRFEVINHTAKGEGRELVKYGVQVRLSYQDDGRTLKVFLTDPQSGEEVA